MAARHKAPTGTQQASPRSTRPPQEQSRHCCLVRIPHKATADIAARHKAPTGTQFHVKSRHCSLVHIPHKAKANACGHSTPSLLRHLLAAQRVVPSWTDSTNLCPSSNVWCATHAQRRRKDCKQHGQLACFENTCQYAAACHQRLDGKIMMLCPVGLPIHKQNNFHICRSAAQSAQPQ